MFYCLKCNETHAMHQTDKIFFTGYILEKDIRVPLGICSTEKDETIQKEDVHPPYN